MRCSQIGNAPRAGPHAHRARQHVVLRALLPGHDRRLGRAAASSPAVAERIDDLDARSLYLACLGNALWFNGDVRGSLDALDRAIALEPASRESEGPRHARAWRAHTLLMMGRFEEAEATDIPAGPLSYPVFKGMSGVAIAATLGGRLVVLAS